MLAIGDLAPDFQTTTEAGESFRLSDKRGRRVVVYFYPGDETPGCTAEACSIRDSYDAFVQKGIDVYGVSGGSRESHERFKQRHRLNFTLLMDEDHAIAKLFGVYKPTKILGKELLGVQRVTFLIDAEGMIEGIFGGSEGLEKVKTREHAGQILSFWGLTL